MFKKILVVIMFVVGLQVVGLSQSNPPLKIKEVDGSPSKTNPTELIFANGSLTISGSKVTVAGGISGSGTAGRFAFWSSSTGLSSDADAAFSVDTATFTKLITTQLTDSGLTSGRVPIASTGGLLADDADLTFTGGNTLNAANVNVASNVTVTGSISTGVGGSVAGTLELVQGTAPSAGTTSVKHYADTAVTSYTMRDPPAAATGFILGTNTAGDVVQTFVGFTGTSTVVRSDSPVLVTPALGVATATSVTTSGGNLVSGQDIVAASNIRAGSAGAFYWNNRTQMYSPSDGVITLYNDANNNFTALQIGGTTNAFYSIRRSGTTAKFRTANDDADSPITFSAFTASGATQTLSNAAFNNCATLGTTSNVITCTVSTRKVKQNFAAFSGGLDTIRKIQPQTFSYKTDTPYYKPGIQLGLIAENLKDANPLLVSMTNPTPSGLMQPEPMALHAIEIDAIKALDAKIARLEAEIAVLKAKSH